MLFRRLAAAVALLFAVLTSQLPEFTQQYRQRLGGAIDELRAIVAQFDAEASTQSLSRDKGIARLKENGDPLAQERGADLEATVSRTERLERQRDAFSTSGPLSQYAVLAENFDPTVARHAYADFQPAVPVTAGGFVAGAIGLLLGWCLTHLVAWPFRRQHRPGYTEHHEAYPR